MKNWDPSIHQHVLVYQGKELELFFVIFVEVIKKFMGSVFLGVTVYLYNRKFRQWHNIQFPTVLSLLSSFSERISIIIVAGFIIFTFGSNLFPDQFRRLNIIFLLYTHHCSQGITFIGWDPKPCKNWDPSIKKNLCIKGNCQGKII